MASEFGNALKLSLFGESHGTAVGAGDGHSKKEAEQAAAHAAIARLQRGE